MCLCLLNEECNSIYKQAGERGIGASCLRMIEFGSQVYVERR